MEDINGILLKTTQEIHPDHFNVMEVGGELGYVLLEDKSASTGYSWTYHPDECGLISLDKEINLQASVDKMVGVPGVKGWVLRARHSGHCGLLFELHAPGTGEVVESRHVRVQVK